LVTWLSSPSAVDWEEGGVRTGLFPVHFSFLLPSWLSPYSETSWWTTTVVVDDSGGGGRQRRWWMTAAVVGGGGGGRGAGGGGGSERRESVLEKECG
jgi:hypothetical protein